MGVVAPLLQDSPPEPPTCRIVSEHRKNKNASYMPPSMCGCLEIRRLGRWLSRHAEVRPGELRVYRPAEGHVSRQLELRLPLRRMSILRAEDEGTLAFSLEPQQTAQQPPTLLRARRVQEYERWVRALAVELMRQTPLEALRFLDVFGITQSRPHAQNSRIAPSVSEPPLRHGNITEERGSQRLARLLSADSIRSRLQGRGEDCPMPVRERRRVFEGLIAANTRTTSVSTDNLCTGTAYFAKQRGSSGLRARSLLDLRHGPSSMPADYPRRSVSIRELCRFFEQGPAASNPPRPESPEEVCLNPFLSKRRVQRGQRRLAALRERAAAAEDAIWQLQEKMAELDRDHLPRRNSKEQVQSFLELERRLTDEERALTSLQAETARVLRSVECAARKLDTALNVGTSSWETASSSGVSSDE